MSLILTPAFVDKLPLQVSKRPKVDWVRTLLPLKELPGKWALLKEFPHGGNTYVTKRSLEGFGKKYKIPPGKWDFKVVRFAMDKWGLYGKFLGEEENEAERA